MKEIYQSNTSAIVTVVSSKGLRIEAEQLVKTNQEFLDFSLKTSVEDLNDFFFNKPELMDSFQENAENLNIEAVSFEQISNSNAKQMNVKSFDNFVDKETSNDTNMNENLLDGYQFTDTEDEFEEENDYEEEFEEDVEEEIEDEFYEEDFFDEDFEEEMALLEEELSGQDEDYEEEFEEDFEEEFEEDFEEEFDEGFDEFWEEDYFLDFYIEDDYCGELTESEVYDELLFLTGMTTEELDFIIDFDYGGDICLFYDEYMAG